MFLGEYTNEHVREYDLGNARMAGSFQIFFKERRVYGKQLIMSHDN